MWNCFLHHVPYEAAVPHPAPLLPEMYIFYPVLTSSEDFPPWTVPGWVCECTCSHPAHSGYMHGIRTPPASEIR